MYMGVILYQPRHRRNYACAPHVYGGDPFRLAINELGHRVLPMYMGVIPSLSDANSKITSAPHVYGGDPRSAVTQGVLGSCSPCIWG